MEYIIAGLVVAGFILIPQVLKRRRKPVCQHTHHYTESVTQEVLTQPQEPIPMPGMSLGVPPLWERQFNEIMFPYWEAQRKENRN